MLHLLLSRRRLPANLTFVHIFLLLAAVSGVWLLGAPLPAWSQPASGASASLQLREFSSSAKSARGEFVQKTFKSTGEVAETTSGQFAFQRPGKFRWDVRKPFEQLMIADGEKVYFFDKDLNQVTVRKLADAMGATPASLLFGGTDLEQQFVMKDAQSKEGVAWLEATPKSKDAGFEKIRIGMKGGQPDSMEVVDAFGRLSQFSFRSVQVNASIAADQFRFAIPKGAEVVQQ